MPVMMTITAEMAERLSQRTPQADEDFLVYDTIKKLEEAIYYQAVRDWSTAAITVDRLPSHICDDIEDAIIDAGYTCEINDTDIATHIFVQW